MRGSVASQATVANHRPAGQMWAGANSHHADVAAANGGRGGGFVGQVPLQLVVKDRGPGILGSERCRSQAG